MSLFNFYKRKKTQSKRTTIRVEQRSEMDVVPVTKRIKRMDPNAFGLYPHEVLLLSYAPSYYIDMKTFPKFWWYRYGVKHVDKQLKTLRKKGFLQVGSIEATVANETSDDLKDILRAHNVNVSGTKAELVERLLAEVPAEKLRTLFTDRTYELTDLGADVLEKEAHIPYIHHHMIEDLDIWSLDDRVKNNPGFSYKDIVWEYMNKKSLKYYKHSDFGLYRNCRFKMAEFLEAEDKADSSFMYLAEVARLDLSGLTNGFNMDYLENYASGYFPYSESSVTLAPGLTERIRRYQKEKNLSDNELKSRLKNLMNRLQLPFSLFTLEEAADIVTREIHGDTAGLERIYDHARERFEAEYVM